MKFQAHRSVPMILAGLMFGFAAIDLFSADYLNAFWAALVGCYILVHRSLLDRNYRLREQNDRLRKQLAQSAAPFN